MLPQIALRNLARNRRRTLSSLLVISVGTACLLLTAGFVRYSFSGLRDAIVNGGLGHFEIVPAAQAGAGATAIEGLPPSFGNWRTTRDLIEQSSFVQGAGAAIQFAGVATHGDRTTAVIGAGVEPDRERRMGVVVRLRRGSDLPDGEPVPGEDRVLLGEGLARRLDAGIGDVITVMVATPDATLNALDLTVSGVFSTGFQDLDARILKIHIATAQQLLGTDRITSIMVRLHTINTLRTAEADLEARLRILPQPLSIITWEARAPFYGQVRALYSGIFVFLGGIVAALVILANSNTLMMSVLERTREFGTLLSIGTTRGQLASLLLWEATWLGLIGTIAGCALGFGVAAVLNALHIKMPPPPAAADPVDLAVSLVPADSLWALAFVIAVVVVAALPPMLRLFRLRIVDALGHV